MCPFQLHWDYPASNSAPPTPHVVDTIEGHPIADPNSGPPTPRTLDPSDAPCPETPHYVPFHQPEIESDAPTGPSNDSDTHNHDRDCNKEFLTSTFVSLLCSESLADYKWPSPVVAILLRAHLDHSDRRAHPVNPFEGHPVVSLFGSTWGRIPRTGCPIVDSETLQYYVFPCHLAYFRNPDSYIYPITCITNVQIALTYWTCVFPQPIPPVVIRLDDLVGDYILKPRADGYAYIVPDDRIYSIWPDVRSRGVDSEYRPISPWAAVLTHFSKRGNACYEPQHTAASQFAVNVFLELTDSATGPNSRCQYLGAYILQLVDDVTISRSHWDRIDLSKRYDIYRRVPDQFGVVKDPIFGWPHFPLIRFRYHKWDHYILGLVEKELNGYNTCPDVGPDVGLGDIQNWT